MNSEPKPLRDETSRDRLRAQLNQGRYRITEAQVAEAILRRLLPTPPRTLRA
jgi:hypothetical protein